MALSSLAPEEAVYLYCFTAPGNAAPALAGVDEGRPVLVHDHGDLAALVSPVAVEDFTGESGERNLQDIAWLGPRACRHAAVVDAALAAGPVFPLPFGTLFSNPAALNREIDTRREEIATALRRTEGCREWSVEGTLDRAEAIDCLFFEGLRTGRFDLPESAGRRHLLEQKARRELASELDGWLATALASLHRELAARSRDAHPRRLREDRILHVAYLVTLENTDDFAAAVTNFGHRYQPYGLALRLTGPWPPYSFCQSAP